jgi:hypothetical protein
LYLQTVLAVLPESGEVLGCAMQEPFVRIPAPAAETRSKRRQRAERETDVWMRQVRRLGSFPPRTTIVHVGDRGADMFPFFQACRATQTHFLVRTSSSQKKEGTGSCSMRCAPGQRKPVDHSRCLPVMDEQLARRRCNWPLAP